MRKHPLTRKALHQHILKEAQLVDALDTLMTQVSRPQPLTTLADEDIQRIAGSNATATKQLRATLQLAHLLAVPQRRQHFTVRLPRDVVQYCRDSIRSCGERNTFLIGLNTKNMITTTECVPEETMQSLTTYQRAIFRHLIIHKCASGILIHMRSAGDIHPSQEEISLSKQIADVGDTVGISILDVIEVTETDYLSYKERGWL
ncbi:MULTISPECIES: JAB domain-containing protein [Brevibacillus]|uniref:JAB domain-containing protein n=1 Tax=Brevibacillus TaxID=55080 RepID=UPI0002719052|nr:MULTISPECIES: JAB domain-containing protein [Brevibacillus]EJL46190.1 DNA repair protein [Brevibacillus sp. CF112]WNF06432.1 JAB domain-containing protein [Brevibacillus borstelensis]